MVSITYKHLLYAIVAELSGRAGLVRLLDMGCGSGGLLEYLKERLPLLCPLNSFEFFGLDVDDFAPDGAARIASNVDVVGSEAVWPYPDENFDIIISNQVLEHVSNHALTLSQIARTLKPGGVSINLFPLRSYIYEGHTFVPFAHRIRSVHWVRSMALLGFGRAAAKTLPRPDLEFGERVVHYIESYTNYIDEDELRERARETGLILEFSYTPKFYTTKLLSVIGRDGTRNYVPHARADYVLSKLLRFVSSVTVVLRRRGLGPSVDARRR